ncbi:MAG: DNA primase catalytic subunit PriS [Thermoplasmataceae archaeon]
MDAAESDQKLRGLFHDYYVNEQLETPDLLQSREIGYIPFNGSMSRHRRILTSAELKYFVTSVVPRHLYYSTSYYRKPEEKKMQEKEWLGAELIFDLDADHIKGAERMTYTQILDEVKKHTLRLIHHFLLGDLGFEESELKVYFSGGRGYHVHVLSEKVYEMSSDSRREITDYIRGENISAQGIIASASEKQFIGGWPRNVDIALSSYFRNLPRVRDLARDVVKGILDNGNTARSFVDYLNRPLKIGSKTMKRIDIFSMEGPEKYSVSESDPRFEKILDNVISQTRDQLSSEIDDPVTTDVHRLIRFPGSLHGKTGLKVINVRIKDMEGFDPLREAIPKSFAQGTAAIQVESDTTIEINGKHLDLAAGKNEVPLYAAVFMVASKRAIFI